MGLTRKSSTRRVSGSGQSGGGGCQRGEDSDGDFDYEEWAAQQGALQERSWIKLPEVTHVRSRTLTLLTFLAGVAVFSGGVTLRLTRGEFDLPAISTCFIGLSLAGRLLCKLFISLLGAIIANVELCICSSARAEVSTVSYFFAGVAISLSRLVWALYTLAVALILSYLTRFKPVPEWEQAELVIRRIFILVSLYYLATALSLGLGMYLTHNFGIRAYEERLRQTMDNELIISLLADSQNADFAAIHQRFHRKTAGQKATKQRTWQRAIHHVNGSHVDGTKTHKETHVPRRPGSTDHLKLQSNKVAGKIFQKVRALTQGSCTRASSGPRALNAPICNDYMQSDKTPRLDETRESAKVKADQNTPRIKTKTLSETSISGRVYKEEAIFSFTKAGLQYHHATQFWALLDPNQTGYFNYMRLRRVVHSLFHDRYSLSLTLQDSQVVIKSMDNMIFAMIVVIMILVAISLQSNDNTQLLATLISGILAWSFVFGQSVATSFSNLVYIFVSHEYDVGDKIEINKDRFEVLRIRLFTTDLLRADGFFVRYDNATLSNTHTIYNFTVSRAHAVSLPFYIPASQVSPDLFKILQAKLDEYAASHPTTVSTLWCSARELVHPLMPGIGGAMSFKDSVSHVRINIWVQYEVNFSQVLAVFNIQTDVIAYISRVLLDIDVVAKPVR